MTTSSYWLTNSIHSGNHRCDVLVIGAGITGLSLAYWLKILKPTLRVSVVDQSELAKGASGRNAGFHTAGSTHYLSHLFLKHGESRARELWSFKQETLRLMREEIFSELSCGFNQWGSYTLYRNDQKLSEHEAIVRRLHTASFKKISPLELEKLGMKGFEGALLFPEEASLSPVLLMRELTQKLKAMGVEFFLNEKILWTQDHGEKWVSTRRLFEADQVFLGVNGYLERFDPSLKWVQPKRAQMLALDLKNQKNRG